MLLCDDPDRSVLEAAVGSGINNGSIILYFTCHTCICTDIDADPQENLSEVIRVPGKLPQALINELVLILLVSLEASLLPVSDDLDEKARYP